MKSIKMTLTAFALATTVIGSALAADGPGTSGTGGTGGADSSSNMDRSKPVLNNSATSGAVNSYSVPTATTTPTNRDPAAQVTGATPNSGETTTDKTLLNSRKAGDNSNAN